MFGCREDLTAATWLEQLGKRTVVGFSSSHRGTEVLGELRLLQSGNALGVCGTRKLSSSGNFCANSHELEETTNGPFFGCLLEVCLNSTRMLQKIIMSIIVGGISELRFCIKHVCR